MARCIPKKSDFNKISKKLNDNYYKNIYKSSNSEERISRFLEFKKELNEIQSDKNTRDIEKAKDRDMTATICSRWYRAPEVILTQDYG